jgi:hypothetical protein
LFLSQVIRIIPKLEQDTVVWVYLNYAGAFSFEQIVEMESLESVDRSVHRANAEVPLY